MAISYVYEAKFGLTPKTKQNMLDLAKRLGKDKLQALILGFLRREAVLAAGYVAKASTSRVGVRTGTLRRSIEGRAELVKGYPAIKVGVFRAPAAVYAAAQELGTRGKGGSLPTIRPRKAKALAVPGPAALTPTGVDRYGGPRRLPKTGPMSLHFIPFKGGKKVVGGLYFERDLKKLAKLMKRKRRTRGSTAGMLRQIRAVYLLMKSVDLKPRHFLRTGFVAFLPGFGLRLKKFLADRVRGAA